MTRQEITGKQREQCQEIVDGLFAVYGADAIIAALAQRSREEAAVAHGEGRMKDARSWDRFAQCVGRCTQDTLSAFATFRTVRLTEEESRFFFDAVAEAAKQPLRKFRRIDTTS